jgi:serine acetyltransferase
MPYTNWLDFIWMKFIEDIRSVFERDPSARNSFEIITTYSGVQAMLFYGIILTQELEWFF